MITVTREQNSLLRDLKNYAPETYYHSLRVKKLVHRLIGCASEAGYVSYSPDEIEIICKGAMLHDVGKMQTDNKILTSAQVLADEQKDILKQHTSEGVKMLRDMLGEHEKPIIEEICLNHHERVDGKGYFGLTDIPGYVQLISVCDVYDALTSDRVYRSSLDRDTALRMISNGECGAFNKWVTDCLHSSVRQVEMQ